MLIILYYITLFHLSSISTKFAFLILPKLFYILFIEMIMVVLTRGIVLHYIVIKYMDHWNGVVLTHAIDLVCYVSKVLNLYALIFG